MGRNQRIAAAILAALCLYSLESRADVLGTFGPVTIGAIHAPAPELAGFSTWTLSASSSLLLQSFDFAGSDATGPFGFFGPMNQNNPVGSPTIFPDTYSAIFSPFFLREQDSHFNYNSVTLILSPGTSSESATTLHSTFAGVNPFTNPTAFAQIVIADSPTSVINFRGTVGFANTVRMEPVTIFGQIGGVPEPASLGLLCMAFFSLLSLSRNRGRECAVK